MTPHVPGLQLSEAFFRQAVKPIVDREFPNLRYAAALIGSESDVLGFDTAMSTGNASPTISSAKSAIRLSKPLPISRKAVSV
jgi:hypothetical protein